MVIDEDLIRRRIEEAEGRRTDESLSDFERHMAAGAKAELRRLLDVEHDS
jgi:hypothetical protein